MEVTPFASTEEVNPPEKRTKHLPTVVSPTQGLLVNISGQVTTKESTKECRHQDWVLFKTWNHKWYQPKRMESKKASNYPTVCCGPGCGKTFVVKTAKDKSFDKTKEFKVTTKQSVHVCPIAVRDYHCCRYAVCQDCFNVIISEKDGMFSPV